MSSLLETVNRDSEGFLVDPNEWSEALAHEFASELGLSLGERHFVVINFMRDEYNKKGVIPSMRAIGKRSGVPIKELYQLYPKGPAKKAAMCAGLGKPKGCI